MQSLYIVVPCYQEEEALPQSAPVLLAKLRGLVAEGKIAPESRLLFVDDGSRDGTWGILEQLAGENADVCALKLSKKKPRSSVGSTESIWQEHRLPGFAGTLRRMASRQSAGKTSGSSQSYAVFCQMKNTQAMRYWVKRISRTSYQRPEESMTENKLRSITSKTRTRRSLTKRLLKW